MKAWISIMLTVLVASLLPLLIRGTSPPPVLPEPQVFYSDWVRDPVVLPPWDAVAGSQDAIVGWLKEVFIREGAPPELVWLAAVESGFDPHARSRRGAVGLFQIMPDTAKRYGLRVSGVDERRDPLLNTQVAARYLIDLYRRFGDWPLVLAAYNAGENRLARVRRLRGGSYASVAHVLPAETRSYVQRVQALVSFQEGIEVSKLRTPFYRRRGTLVAADMIEP